MLYIRWHQANGTTVETPAIDNRTGILLEGRTHRTDIACVTFVEENTLVATATLHDDHWAVVYIKNGRTYAHNLERTFTLRVGNKRERDMGADALKLASFVIKAIAA